MVVSDTEKESPMFDIVKGILDYFPPLRVRKNEHIAALLGFVTGGVGLCVYLWSLVDLLIPLFFTIVLVAAFGYVGWLGGALVASIWGYFRVINSNARLAEVANVAHAMGS
jgi:hypothetical protein